MHYLSAGLHTSCIAFWVYPKGSADWREATVVLHVKALEENEY